jgi:hypothetical protein
MRNFWLSRSRPAPGTLTTSHSMTCAPGPMLAAARTKDPAASTASRTAPSGQRALSARQPATLSASRRAVANGASTDDRLPGTVCAFQMPPVPASAPRAPLQFSARAANAATPSGSERPPAVLVTAATTQGAQSAAVPAIAARPARIGSSTATVASAISPPVGVTAAGAAASTRRASA